MELSTKQAITPVFSIKNFSFYYPEQTAPAIDSLDFSLDAGEFVVLCGASGCGKSTLLRQLKTVLAPHGHRLGDIAFQGTPLSAVDQRTQSEAIGFVQQSPDNQVVTDKVWHELAFGLESLGYDTPTIRRRVAEMASFFGIQTWFYRNVNELSGGQKQLLNLASVMAMQPAVLILDEPTSQLDPIAASDFLATLGKINRELGTTILLTEHRLEEALPLASRVAVMDGGRLIAEGAPKAVGQTLKAMGHGMFLAMPTPMRVWAGVESAQACPITVSEGRQWLAHFAAEETPLRPAPPAHIPAVASDVALRSEGLWFRYEKEGADVVKGLDFTVKKGEFLALLGGNGTGKTTTLKLLASLRQGYRGHTEAFGTVGLLPQNPQALFVKKTVRDDLFEVLADQSLSKSLIEQKTAHVVALCRLAPLLDRHPYDLSGGEQQRVALAKILLLDPEILLLDEPTKGLDVEFKEAFAQILRTLLARRVTIVMVSHDIEFCAQYAHRCALFFDGSIVTEGTPKEFFSGNSFYTTATNRMSRGICDGAVTPDDLIAVCGGTPRTAPPLPSGDVPLPPVAEHSPSAPPKKLPLWRKLTAVAAALVALVIVMRTLAITDLSALISQAGISQLGTVSLQSYAVLAGALVIFTAAIGRKSRKTVLPPAIAPEKRPLPRRTLVATAVVLLLVPLTLLVGVTYLEGRKYYFIALLILLECIAPFFLLFEGRKPQARELVVIAVLCGLAVTGRAMLFMLPQFKPVMSLAIVAGVAFGGETGFLVGAMSMLVSNVLFAQGPWTPWQMFAMGLIGFLAGILFRKGLLRRTKLSLATFGFLATIVIYGGIMNPASALVWATQLTPQLLATYYITGLPMDIIQGIATALFLWWGGEPMLEKLDRIKVKYGILTQ